MIKSYGQTIDDTLIEMMDKDPSIYIIGQGANDPTSANGPLNDVNKKFPSRIMDVPMSEEAVAGACIGMAMNGLRPINWHIRMDFMLVCMNQIVNMASKISYMYGGRLKAPIVFRGMVGKSWGQGPQHSQSLYPLFAHIPGLMVYAPVVPNDVANVYKKTLTDNNPSLIMEHRLLYYQYGEVLEDSKYVPVRKLRDGKDITLVGISQMAVECMRAASMLEKTGISAEVLNPIDLSTDDCINDIYSSVNKTRKLIVVDNDWIKYGFGSDIVGVLHKEDGLDFESCLMGFANTVCPTSPTLEKVFYPNPIDIAEGACDLLHHSIYGLDKDYVVEEVMFKGPF